MQAERVAATQEMQNRTSVAVHQDQLSRTLVVELLLEVAVHVVGQRLLGLDCLLDHSLEVAVRSCWYSI